MGYDYQHALEQCQREIRRLRGIVREYELKDQNTVYVCACQGENRGEEILDTAKFRHNLEHRAQRRADQLARETAREDWTVLKITYTGHFGMK